MCSLFSGQGRIDGAFCDYTEQDKMDYLETVHKAGVVNIEMESLSFAALTHHAGIKSAVICVTLMDRLKGDQVNQQATTRLIFWNNFTFQCKWNQAGNYKCNFYELQNKKTR